MLVLLLLLLLLFVVVGTYASSRELHAEQGSAMQASQQWV
jgi:hypothetical protein